ncbi:hypothetical protein LSAT2_007414 [Lamellibrachia satsuma]|nr:hypothetical protein LSAT2_007414 [Lamellibrachia satsuma]
MITTMMTIIIDIITSTKSSNTNNIITQHHHTVTITSRPSQHTARQVTKCLCHYRDTYLELDEGVIDGQSPVGRLTAGPVHPGRGGCRRARPGCRVGERDGLSRQGD